MATLTTSPQVIGSNTSGTIHTYLYGWYSDQSGNNCTVHVRLTAINTGATYTGTNKSYAIRVGSYDSDIQAWSYTPLNTNQEYTVAEATWSYSSGNQIGASGLFWSYNYGSADITSLNNTWYVPTFTTPPSGLNASVAEVYPNGAKLSLTLGSYGNPSSATGRYIEGAILSTNHYGAPYRYTPIYNTSSSDVVVNNTSSGTLSIQPNTQYYYGMYANNTQAAVGTTIGTLVTTAATYTIDSIDTTNNTATFTYSVGADGGQYPKTLEYSLDGTNWNTFATISSGAAITNLYTITGLTPSTTYTLKTRVTTTAGTTNNPDTTFTTFQGFYGSVSGQTKNIDKLYGSVNGQSKLIKKVYGSVNGQSKLIYKG